MVTLSMMSSLSFFSYSAYRIIIGPLLTHLFQRIHESIDRSKFSILTPTTSNNHCMRLAQ